MNIQSYQEKTKAGIARKEDEENRNNAKYQNL